MPVRIYFPVMSRTSRLDGLYVQQGSADVAWRFAVKKISWISPARAAPCHGLMVGLLENKWQRA
jgi:hypothetical protein